MTGIKIKVKLDNDSWSYDRFDNEEVIEIIITQEDIQRLLNQKGLIGKGDYIHSMGNLEEIYGRIKN